jgi:hypothetical protein
VIASAVVLAGNAQATDSVCSQVLGGAPVTAPGHALAWRVGIEARTAVFYHLPSKSLRPSRWLSLADAPWLLALARPRVTDGRCWLRVRLP